MDGSQPITSEIVMSVIKPVLVGLGVVAALVVTTRNINPNFDDLIGVVGGIPTPAYMGGDLCYEFPAEDRVVCYRPVQVGWLGQRLEVVSVNGKPLN